MYLSRCSFVFEFIAVVIIVPGTQWSLCITWNGRIYMHEWGAYDLILLSVWPIYVTNVRKGLSKSRKLDLQLVAQLRGDWTFRGFVHWWVCSEQSIWSWSPAEGIRTVGGGAKPVKGVSRLWFPVSSQILQSGFFSPLLFLHNVSVLPQAQSNSQLSVAEISETQSRREPSLPQVASVMCLVTEIKAIISKKGGGAFPEVQTANFHSRPLNVLLLIQFVKNY